MLKTQTKPFHTSILLCTLVGNGFCGYQTHYFCNCTIVGNCKFGLPGGVSSWQDKHPPWGKISQRGVHIWWIGCICYQSWVLCNQPVNYKITMNKIPHYQSVKHIANKGKCFHGILFIAKWQVNAPLKILLVATYIEKIGLHLDAFMILAWRKY